MSLVVTCGAALLIVGCSSDPADECVPGSSAPCECADGAAGAHRCDDDGTFGGCQCDPASSHDEPDAGGADATPCVPADETCDGTDEDCDRVVDEGPLCPVGEVQGGEPFAGTIYLLGSGAEGSCTGDAIQRFWPTTQESYVSDFPCEATRFELRPSDGAIFYQEWVWGIHENTDPDGDDDPLVKTLPCGTEARLWRWDGEDTIHYQCGDTIRRGNGWYISSTTGYLVATLSDGRVVTAEPINADETAYDYVAVGPDGIERSRISPHVAFGQDLTWVFDSTTVQGNTAQVLFWWEPDDQTVELVAYRLDAQDRWTQMRRLRLANTSFEVGRRQMVTSDGTIWVRGRDPEELTQDQITAYPPNGPPQVVWREFESETVKSHGTQQMLVGPPP